jgi:heme-degrading monooxygenase HmoA
VIHVLPQVFEMIRSRIAATPRPPYYAAITTAELAPEPQYDSEAHRALGIELFKSAQRLDGFLGLEVFFDGAASVALSYWKTMESIDAWRNDPVHRVAKQMGKSAWFGPCITRIARIESDYGFNLPGSVQE